MQDKIVNMAKRHAVSTIWIRPIVDQLLEGQFIPIGDKVGKLTVEKSLQLLTVRLSSLKAAKVLFFGMEELLKELKSRNGSEIVNTLSFNSNMTDRWFLTFYWDGLDNIIGSTLIEGKEINCDSLNKAQEFI